MPQRPADRAARARVIFVAIALGLSAAHGILFELAAHGIVHWQPSRDVFGALRSFGPALAAVIAAYYQEGAGGLRALRGRLFRIRTNATTYAFALLGPALAIAVTMAIAYRVHPEAFTSGDVKAGRLILIFFILPFVDGPLGEEIGWRGYFLPSLLRRYGALASSVIVGAVWFAWHVPLYHADGMSLSAAMLGNYLAFVTALSCIHTWLFLRSGQSAFVSILFHNATNYVVLVSVTVFPMLRHLPVFEDIYNSIAISLGVVTAIALLRKAPQSADGRYLDSRSERSV